jgi:predicted nucleic acid-binding protein
MGTVALLLAANRAGRLGAVAHVLRDLLAAGFRLSEEVLVAALRAAGEG